jgi:predicted transcriptional regulator
MLSKEKIWQTVKNLPDEFSVEELFERIIRLQKIELGLAQSVQGKVVTEEEARKRLGKWLSK